MRFEKSLWLGGIVVLGACAAQTKLEPAITANQVAGMENAAAAQRENIELIAQSDAWDGETVITHEVTPVRVLIDNNGKEPVAIRYENLVLVAADGTRYRAIPPLKIEGEAPTVAQGYAPITPYYGYDSFHMAPYYGPAYPGITTFGGPFAYDRDYYSTYYNRWATAELPTPDMLERALPEGVLNAGGRVEGFVYFEKVKDDAQQVLLTAELVNPQTNGEVVTLTIPFVVTE